MHAPPSCALFKSKTPEERLAVVRRRELCILCFRHLDTKRCWSLGKVSNCNVRYLSEPNCLIQKAGPIHVLLGMDHAHLIPEHVAKSTDLSSQLRLMSSMFGGQHILAGEGAPRLSWIDAMDADERYEAAANGRKK